LVLFLYLGLAVPVIRFYIGHLFYKPMATRSEIIAILASGTSYNRMLRPYFIGEYSSGWSYG
jgi:lipopolysaccharide export system permease protein